MKFLLKGFSPLSRLMLSAVLMTSFSEVKADSFDQVFNIFGLPEKTQKEALLGFMKWTGFWNPTDIYKVKDFLFKGKKPEAMDELFKNMNRSDLLRYDFRHWEAHELATLVLYTTQSAYGRKKGEERHHRPNNNPLDPVLAKYADALGLIKGFQESWSSYVYYPQERHKYTDGWRSYHVALGGATVLMMVRMAHATMKARAQKGVKNGKVIVLTGPREAWAEIDGRAHLEELFEKALLGQSSPEKMNASITRYDDASGKKFLLELAKEKNLPLKKEPFFFNTTYHRTVLNYDKLSGLFSPDKIITETTLAQYLAKIIKTKMKMKGEEIEVEVWDSPTEPGATRPTTRSTGRDFAQRAIKQLEEDRAHFSSSEGGKSTHPSPFTQKVFVYLYSSQPYNLRQMLSIDTALREEWAKNHGKETYPFVVMVMGPSITPLLNHTSYIKDELCAYISELYGNAQARGLLMKGLSIAELFKLKWKFLKEMEKLNAQSSKK